MIVKWENGGNTRQGGGKDGSGFVLWAGFIFMGGIPCLIIWTLISIHFPFAGKSAIRRLFRRHWI